MAISINWSTQVIYVPRADLTSLGGGIYELDLDVFRLALKDLEDGEDGISFPDTHRHNTEVTLSGTTYARTVEIINGYTVEFEDVGSPYTVKCTGANHNIADVKVVNQVSLIIGNSAGLISAGGGGGSSAADIWNHTIETGFSAAELLKLVSAIIAGKTTITVTAPGEATIVFRDVTDSRNAATFDMLGSERTNRVDDL